VNAMIYVVSNITPNIKHDLFYALLLLTFRKEVKGGLCVNAKENIDLTAAQQGE
jgi:hypothetical protein